MKTKRTYALMAAMLMAAGCASGSDASKTDDSSNTTAPAEDAYKIGIIEYADHPALDATVEGFQDYMEENNVAVDIDFKSAQGEQANCTTIAQTFVNDKVDLIYAVATPAAQATANATKDIPIVTSAVTDLETADLVESNEKPGTNVTGASDLNPIEAQLNLLKQILPDAKKIAIMYCNAEENSRFQAKLAEEVCDKLGLEYEEATVTETNQIQQVVESLAGKVDAIYIPTDNMLAKAMPTVTQAANDINLPCIVGEEGMVEQGGLATYGIDYYELGKMAGAQVEAILKGESNPADMPVVFQTEDECALAINSETAKKLGITFPEDVTKDAKDLAETTED